MERVQRFDLSGFRAKPEETPQGFLKLTGNLTRTGVLTYRTKDGKTVRELRHPDDVFAQDSVDSLAIAPLTDMHPPEMVSAKNTRENTRGSVRAVAPAGRYITGEILVQDAELIEKVRAGERRELSPGYTCTLEWGEGEYEGEKYDARQRNIVYNHLALGPSGWGRSGPEVSVHMDSAATEIALEDGDQMKKAKKQDEAAAETQAVEDPKTTANSEAEATETEENDIPQISNAEADEQAEEVEAKTDGAAEALASLVNKNAELAKEIETLTANLDAANEMLKPEHFRAAVQKRVAVESRAQKILGQGIKFDGLSDSEVLALALSAKGIATEGKSSDYIEARFDAMLETVGVESIREVRADSLSAKPVDPRQRLIDAMNARKK